MQNNNAKIQKEEFLINEIGTLSILGGFGRANIYKGGVGENDKNSFRRFIRKLLEQYGKRYHSGNISEETHFMNIEKFSTEVTAACGRLLKGNRFRIGVAQKVVNLYLKYLWVLGLIPGEPPHCPFDSQIIGKLSLPDNICKKWTKCDHLECYRVMVEHAKRCAGSKSITEWELGVWNIINSVSNFQF